MNKIDNKRINIKLKKIFHYFAIFDYFPSFWDVYTFFPTKISQKQLKKIYEAKKYTVGEYSKSKSRSQKSRYVISKKILNNWRFRAYVKLISLFSQIKLVGLSGSISMMNANKNDDIDLFVITGKNRLFTGRFIALTLAHVLGIRRKRNEVGSKNKVCLNLFFDERNLKIPKQKHSIFVGHEVLQMKPLINKEQIYERFLNTNQWVYELFPNAVCPVMTIKVKKKNKQDRIARFIEKLFKKFQLRLIKKHQTTETITDTQLWFHPVDFEKKIKLP